MAAHDLAALWDAHCRFEFETRDVDATMATMVAEPYVNHIPTMTGGVGFDKLRDFYANHFIGVNPPDFELVPVSRTVGETSVVDELVAGSLTPHILIGCCPGSNRRGAPWRFR
jgi:carboxymethylenebutenolidase